MSGLLHMYTTFLMLQVVLGYSFTALLLCSGSGYTCFVFHSKYVSVTAIIINLNSHILILDNMEKHLHVYHTDNTGSVINLFIFQYLLKWISIFSRNGV